MAQRNIDFGTFPDDPSADAIRTAFNKVQQNFSELYSSIDAQAVLSINQVPGPGISVNNTTGNVIVSANISSVTLTSTTLAVGSTTQPVNRDTITANGTISSSIHELQVELPKNITNVDNITIEDALDVATINVNDIFINESSDPNVSGGGNITFAGANTGIIGANLISANFFSGDGSGLTSLAGSSVTGEVANAQFSTEAENANTANIANIANSATTAETVTASAQPNITSVGELTSLVVLGNITAGNANLGNLVTADFFSGNGNGLSNITGENVTGTVANATHAITANTVVDSTQSNITSVGTLTGLNVDGDFVAGNITSNTGVISGNGSGLTSLTGANVTGEVANAQFATSAESANTANTANSATIANTVTENAQPNITSVGTLTSLDVTGNVSATDVSATTLGGTLTTAAQPNITSVGELISLDVTGNVTADNLLLTDSNLVGNILSFAGNTIIKSDAGRVDIVAEDAGSSLTWRFDIDGSLTTPLGGNISAGNVSATDITAITLGGTLTTALQPNVTSLGTLTSLTVSGNTISDNVIANNYHIRSVETGIEASGSNQADATEITKEINIVSTASGTDGVRLPVAVPGMVIIITNTTENLLNVYPASGGTINGLVADEALVQSSEKTLQFIAPTTTQWYTVGAITP